MLHLQLSDGAKVLGFADDLLLIKPIPSVQQEQELADDINTIVNYYRDVLSLSINPSKSKVLVSSIAPKPLMLKSPLLISGEEIMPVSKLKYLGVMFDRKLDFSENANVTATKCRQVLGVLHRNCKPVIGTHAFVQLYQAKVLPILTYSLAAVCPSLKGAFCQLEKVHRLAARFVCNDYISSYDDLLDRLQWQSISRLCFQKRSALVYKYTMGLRSLPDEVLKYNIPSDRQLLLRNPPHPRNLAIIHTNRTTIDKNPFWNCLCTWNSLPNSIKDLGLTQFMKAVKTKNLFNSVQALIPERLLTIDNL